MYPNEKGRADPLLLKLTFLVDITSHMNGWNLELQERHNLIYDLDRIIEGFWKKLSLFEAQLEEGHFLVFSVSNSCVLDSQKMSTLSFRRSLLMT